MKVILVTNLKQVEMVEWDMPTLLDDEVLVRSRMVSLGPHDADFYKGNMQVAFPFVPGGAWVGEVAKVGIAAPHQLLGQRVMIEQPTVEEANISLIGGLAEYVAVSPSLLHEIAATMPLEDAAMLSSVAEVVHSFQRSATHTLPYHAASSIEHASHIIAIVGDDVTGLLAVQVAHALYPASLLVMIGFQERRLSQGKSMGATHTINIGREDALGLVRALSRGRGADITFEGTGDAQAAVEAMLLARRAGTVLLMGNAGANALLSVEGDMFVRNNLTVYGSSGTDSDAWTLAEHLYNSHQLNLSALISHRFTLDEYQDAFDELVGGQGRALRVQVTL